MENANKLACILKELPEGLIVCDREKLCYLNERARYMLGETSPFGSAATIPNFE